ncbi:MAG: M42 family metallopeptidase [Acholeplasmataceae bacterium]|nr:M42 family metallopeptidase [Acholeplasmataceae bacterium]
MLNKIYKDLFTIQATSGYEKPVRDYMRSEMEKYSDFEISSDRLGSIFAVKQAKDKDAPVVMVAGHMDEVGLMVVSITDFGMLKLQNIGGLNGEVFISQVLNVHTKNGVIKGVIGALPPHLKQDQQTKISDLILDIGATSKEEALSFGVQLGNMVLFDNPFSYTYNKKRVISKAIDNRYGCGLALETIKAFSNKDLPFTLVVGATVQEEVGLRGAETSVQKYNPDIFLALDASPVNDMTSKEALGKLGDGFLLRLYDPRNVIHQGLLNYLVKLGNKHKIKYQYFVSKGGTDAAKALDLNDGILATTIGLPARYIHSTAAMMDLADLESAKKMLFRVLKDLSVKKIKMLKEGLDI